MTKTVQESLSQSEIDALVDNVATTFGVTVNEVEPEVTYRISIKLNNFFKIILALFEMENLFLITKDRLSPMFCHPLSKIPSRILWEFILLRLTFPLMKMVV